MAEFKVSVARPGEISFNYEELKAEVSAKASEYASYVYTPETIGDAKTDRAKLSKLKTALNEERLKREREFMEPFNGFKAQVNEIIKILEGPIASIDEQIKAVENEEKDAKRNECIIVYNSQNPPAWLTFSRIENPKWLNKTCSLHYVEDEIKAKLSKVKSDLDTIENVSKNPSVSKLHYMENLDLGKALEYAESLEKVSAPVSTPVEEDTEEPEWKSFDALLTPHTAKMLAGFCKLNGIKLRKHEEA